MGKRVLAFFIFLSIVTGCRNNKTDTTSNAVPVKKETLVEIDVTKSYPLKELKLQDIADIEYVPLETNKDFICTGGIVAITDTRIVMWVPLTLDILIFDRKGNALKKINRKGLSGEEYLEILDVVLDESANELYINAGIHSKKILVYDLDGNFKRSFKFIENFICANYVSFDEKRLLCTISDSRVKTNSFTFGITNKNEGKIDKIFTMPISQKLDLMILLEKRTNFSNYIGINVNSIISDENTFIVFNTSCDTIYRLTQDYKFIPLFIRTPSIHEMKEPLIFLFPGVDTNRYHFFLTIQKEYNEKQDIRFPEVPLMYDKKEDKIYTQNIYNDDFTNKEPFVLNFMCSRFKIGDNMAARHLRAYELKEAYEEGRLKGKLKEIASKLDEEDNPVLMIMKFKE